MLNQRSWECTPHTRGSAPRGLGLALAISTSVFAGAALADATGDEPPSDARVETVSLDGTYLALGPRGGAVTSEEGWDAAFGAELMVYRYREDQPLSVLGASVGMIRFSELDGGHLLAEVGAGTDLARGPRLGAALGVTARHSPTRHLRYGAHATLWAFAGAIPYARVGVLQGTEIFADFGLRIALPAFRF